MQLLGFCVEAGQRFASITNMNVGEGNQEAPVGTTMALLEQGTRVMSAVHKRLHYAQKLEFQILARLFSEYLPSEYPYQVVGGDQAIKQSDFDDRVDVIPVSDPNFFSMSQRITLAQQELQLVQSNPELHNIKEAYRRMYQALGSENIEALLLPEPPPPAPVDPAQENGAALMGAPLSAFPEQDHAVHIEAHLSFLASSIAMVNPMVAPGMVSHMFQHISLQAQNMVDQQMPEQEQPMQPDGTPQEPQPNPQKDALKAKIEVQLMSEMMPRLEEIMKPPEDGVVQLKEKELQIRAKENEDDKLIAEKKLKLDAAKLKQKDQSEENDKRMAEKKLKLDAAKLKQKDQSEEEKLKSQEDIAAMRVGAERERSQQDRGNR
jgi:F0F1-type ATP synthase epsilon subunit